MTATPWHALGHDVSAATTALEAMRLGGLTEWGVRREALHADVGGRSIPVPDRWALVAGSAHHDPSPEVLAVVGREAGIEQNEAYAALLLDGLVEETGATFAAAGVIGTRQRAFVALRMPGYLSVEGDRVDLYAVLVIDRAEGSTRASLLVSPVHAATGAVLPSGAEYDPPDGTMPVTPLAHPGHAADYVLDTAERVVEWWRRLAARAEPNPHALIGPAHDVDRTIEGTRARAAAEARVDATLALLPDRPLTRWDAWVALCAWHDRAFPVRVRTPRPGLTRDGARLARAVLDQRWKHDAAHPKPY